MKNPRLWWRLLFVLSGLSTLGFLVLYPRLPAELPLNYNMAGEITAWGAKWHYLLLACVPPLACLGLYLLPRVDPRRRNWKKHRRAHLIIAAITTGMLVGLNWAMLLPVLGIPLRVDSAITLIVGLAMVGMGNYMPQVRSNFFMGIRTPWALSDERVWQRTHRMGGIVFCVGGVCMVLASLLDASLMLAALTVLLAGVLWTCVYSYLVFRKLKEEDKHA